MSAHGVRSPKKRECWPKSNLVSAAVSKPWWKSRLRKTRIYQQIDGYIAGEKYSDPAADASALPLFRQLLPREVLSPGQMVSVATVTLLMAQLDCANRLYSTLGDGTAFEIIRTALMACENSVARHGGAVVKTIEEGVIATFGDSNSAVAATI